MRMRIAALLALSLAACSEPEEAPAPKPAPAAPSPLTGEWTVAQIWGSDPDPGTTVIQVTITNDRIRAQSQCKHYWWTYRTAGDAFDAEKETYPEPMCERTESYWEQYFAEAIERANIAYRRPNGAVLITGPGGQVLIRPKS